ncbi:zinc finger domain-containing protein [Streptomyces roseoviridis]|uniref:zinc finger domain-containing protein n=1 Tax=Streptomyces roseoviridis TaxID=67361 RepID=UPI003CD0ACC4
MSDTVLDGAYEALRLYRHGAFSVVCPTCHVPAGELCLTRRSVHAGRRRAHRESTQGHTLLPLLAGRPR